LDLKKFLLAESNEVDDVTKANETVCASNPLTVTDTSTVTDTPCPSEVEHIVNTVCFLTQLQKTSNHM
jgi:hypothetical protein